MDAQNSLNQDAKNKWEDVLNGDALNKIERRKNESLLGCIGSPPSADRSMQKHHELPAVR